MGPMLMGAGGRSRGLPTIVSAARDLLGLSLCVIAAVALLSAPAVVQLDLGNQIDSVLILSAAVVGVATAILGDTAARLSDNHQPVWIAAAVGVYSIVVVPSTTLWPSSAVGDVVVRTARLAGFVAVVALLVVAIRPPPRLGSWGAWAAAGLSAVLTAAAGHAASRYPDVLQVVTAPAVLTATALVAWCSVAGVLVLAGYRSNPPIARVGLGLLLVAGAHLYRIVAGLDVFEASLLFDGLRILGLLVVLLGMLQLTAVRVRAVRSERLAQQEQLRLAALHMQRASEQAAERDHELRNGLVGLAGVAQLLSSSADSPEHERLRAAALRELARLSEMIELKDSSPARDSYEVDRVLIDLVMVRPSRDQHIELDAPAGLRALGSPAVLAQVVTNLLANCARHAPGAPVRVTAGACGSRIVIEVRDEGAGLPPGQERLVLERGVRNPVTGGSGLGLHVSQRLLASEGGTLRLLPHERARTGCTAIVELPRALDDPAESGEDPRGSPLTDGSDQEQSIPPQARPSQARPTQSRPTRFDTSQFDTTQSTQP
jgi:two-component system OmpR family sensor kinase